MNFSPNDNMPYNNIVQTLNVRHLQNGILQA